jgi:hypothetical protein
MIVNNKTIKKGEKTMDEEKRNEEKTVEQLPVVFEKNVIGNLDEFVSKAEKQIIAVKKIKELAIRATNESDWCFLGDRPYLDNKGAMKTANIFGVSFVNMSISPPLPQEDAEGKYITFNARGKAEFRGIEVEDVGTGSTRDKIFYLDKGRKRALEEIDLNNVKKKAVTNLQNRLLKKILGLGFTKEDLIKAGLDTSKIVGVKYDGKKAGGGNGSGKPIDKPNFENKDWGDRKITPKQIGRLEAIMKSVNMDENTLKRRLFSEYGTTTKKDILMNDYNELCDWVENIHKDNQEEL